MALGDGEKEPGLFIAAEGILIFPNKETSGSINPLHQALMLVGSRKYGLF